MIATNHLYPIRETQQQKSISQINVGQKPFCKHKDAQPQKRTTHTFNHSDEILMMIGENKYESDNTIYIDINTNEVVDAPTHQYFDLHACSNDIFVCLQQGVVHSSFYKLLQNHKWH